MKPIKTETRRLTQLALLLALVLIMAYTPLGYLPIGPLSLSLLTIPVAIGAMLLGPAGGAILGTAFGLTSFMSAMEGKSAMGTALFTINPVWCFVVTVAARLLCGLLCALIYRAVCELLPNRTKLCCALGGLAAPVLNTILFMGMLVFFYYDSDYVQGLVSTLGVSNPLTFVIALVGIQGVIEAVVCCAVSAAVTVPLLKFLGKKK